MNKIKEIINFISRLKHPVSQPEDVGKDLGLQMLHNEVTFKECIEYLTHHTFRPQKLTKFMHRETAEEQFKRAIKSERFQSSTLFSYYLYHGWLAFELVFDDENKLRRMYFQHKNMKLSEVRGLEVRLKR